MFENETMERFNEGLAKAADRAKQLSKLNGSHEWRMIAVHLNSIVTQGQALAATRSLTRQQVLDMTQDYADKMDVH